MTQHPWSADGTRVVQPGRFRTIAECYHNQHVTRDEALAHARICAAAPEMMEALKALLIGIDKIEAICGGAALFDAETTANAALAKARGE